MFGVLVHAGDDVFVGRRCSVHQEGLNGAVQYLGFFEAELGVGAVGIKFLSGTLERARKVKGLVRFVCWDRSLAGDSVDGLDVSGGECVGNQLELEVRGFILLLGALPDPVLYSPARLGPLDATLSGPKEQVGLNLVVYGKALEVAFLEEVACVLEAIEHPPHHLSHVEIGNAFCLCLAVTVDGNRLDLILRDELLWITDNEIPVLCVSSMLSDVTDEAGRLDLCGDRSHAKRLVVSLRRLHELPEGREEVTVFQVWVCAGGQVSEFEVGLAAHELSNKRLTLLPVL